MIFKHIKIHNYKTYLDLDLDLTVKPDRPLILIGGSNGGGKTTLFEAINGALYGLNIKNQAHFSELLNNGAVGKIDPTIELELTFSGLVLGREYAYILRRTYKLNEAGRPVEGVYLNFDGTEFRYGTASTPSQRAEGEQNVNKIIKANLPQELSKYFLFDAMQSSELLKENVFAQIIRENIQNVMGFNKYLLLKNASELLLQEWTLRRLEAQQEAQEYNELCQKKNSLQEEQKLNTKETDEIYKFLVSIQHEYDAAKAGISDSQETQRKIGELEENVKETKRLSTNYNTQLKSFIESLELNSFYPHLAELISNEVNEIIRHKDALHQENKEILSQAILQDVTNKILAYLKNKMLCPNNVENEPIVNYLLTQQKQLVGEDKFAFIDESELEALKELLHINATNIYETIQNSRFDIEKRLENFDNQQSQITILKNGLCGVNTKIIEEYENKNQRLDILKKEFIDRNAEITKLETRIQRFDLQMQQEPDVKYDTLAKLKPFFENVADSLLKRKKEKIEEEMKQQLNKLIISYKNCISKVVLSDSMTNFSIKLFHKAGNEISLNLLNAASKQIFIQVLLKVLRNLGDYNPPVMIDTVMGVIDEESREVLMEEYFPGLAEQTILLCTTSEIRKDSDFEKLKPFASRLYTLTRNVEEQNTSVNQGYFGIQLED